MNTQDILHSFPSPFGDSPFPTESSFDSHPDYQTNPYFLDIDEDSLTTIQVDAPVTISLDTMLQLKKKPRDKQKNIICSQITKRVTNPESVTTLSVDALASHCSSGYSILPGFCTPSRKAKDWKYQQVFAIDVDEGMTIEQFQKLCTVYGIQTSFIYHTLSHSEKKDKFRPIFISHEPITDPAIAQAAIMMLIKLFDGKCDDKCIDLSRMFFGGKSFIDTGMTNRLHISRFIERFPDIFYLKYRKNQKNYSKDLKCLFNSIQKKVTQVFGTEGVMKMSSLLEGSLASGIYIPTAILSSKSQLNSISTCYDSSYNEGKEEDSTSPPFSLLPQSYVADWSTETKNLLLSKCQLLDTFFNHKSNLKHEDLLLIMSNLKFINGGKKAFFQTFQQNPHYLPKLNRYRKSIYENQIEPKWKNQHCGRCSMKSSCPNAHYGSVLNFLTQKQAGVKRISEPISQTLEGERKQLEQMMIEAINSTDDYLIKSSTGSGKTENLLKLQRASTIVAFKTHQLKSQVQDRAFAKNGIQPIILYGRPTFPLSLEAEIKGYEDLGLFTISKELIQKYIEDTKSGHADDPMIDVGYGSCKERIHTSEAAKRYLEKSFISDFGDSLVYTTMENILQYSNLPFNHLIVDEDILPLLKKVVDISVFDIGTMIENTDNEEMKNWLESIMNAPIGKPYIIPKNHFSKAVRLSTLKRLLYKVDSSVAALFACKAFIRTAKQVFCLVSRNLPKVKINTIMLSATFDVDVHTMFFPNMNFKETIPAKLLGVQQQKTNKGYTKSSKLFERRRKGKAFHKQVIEDQNEYSFDGIICYKEDTESIDGKMYLKGTNGAIEVFAYFNNLEGLNHLQGKNIGIYGTPFCPPEVYRLMLFDLGIEVTDEESKFKLRRIMKNGFSFLLNCPSHPLLQKIQTWHIESQLVQAAGRNRLVSHEATTTIFSSYPLPQSQLIEETKEN